MQKRERIPLLFLSLILLTINCRKNESSPKADDLLTLLTYKFAVERSQCILFTSSGESLVLPVMYPTATPKLLSSAKGTFTQLTKVSVVAGQSIEFKSTITDMSVDFLGYFATDSCPIDQKVYGLFPVLNTDSNFNYEVNNANTKTIVALKNGNYYLEFSHRIEDSNTSDIFVRYK